MRLFRRSYVEIISVLGLAAVVLAIVRAVADSNLAWLGAALPWAGILGFLGVLLFGHPSTTSRHPFVLDAIALVGLIVATAAGWLAVLVALLGLVAIQLYAYWYSRQHVPRGGIAVGSPLPEFPLTALDGSTVSSAVLRDGPRVILFYRGNWCPFCMVQVQQLAEQYRELDRRGVGVTMISPQKASDTAELATRFDVPMEFYSDTDGAAAAALDLVQKAGIPMLYGAGTSGDTVVPSVVITDATGTVVWAEVADNHRIRPEPATFLEVLDREGISRVG